MFDVTCSADNFSINYSFRVQRGKRQRHITKTITQFSQRPYLLALVFRQELYKLKPGLYALVTKVFDGKRNTDQRFADWWNYLNNQNGNTTLLDSNRRNVDPTNLLKIVARHRYFRRRIYNHLRNAADRVYLSRHEFYGHIPELLLRLSGDDFQQELNQIDRLSGLISFQLNRDYGT